MIATVASPVLPYPVTFSVRDAAHLATVLSNREPQKLETDTGMATVTLDATHGFWGAANSQIGSIEEYLTMPEYADAPADDLRFEHDGESLDMYSTLAYAVRD